MDIDFLKPTFETNMNENDLFKIIKGQQKKGLMGASIAYQENLEKELEAFKESWSKRSKGDLLEALLKIKKCELEMRFGQDRKANK